jgi:SAM-dependent methyltransferase
MKSYASFGILRSYWQLRYAFEKRKSATADMSELYAQLKVHEKRIEGRLGRPLEDLRILEIGPGQGMERARYLGIHNKVIGIDLDVLPVEPDLKTYYQMLRKNGLGRVLKTMGRKLILDPVYKNEWENIVGVQDMVYPELIQGDICQDVPDTQRYDLVVSWSVFEHLPDPRKALENIIAALRPGGVFYLSIHLFTSINGSHDIRAFTGMEDQLPLWGHLRPSTQHLIEPSSYLNEWRLAQWRDLFQQVAPGSTEFLEAYDYFERYAPQLTTDLRMELEDYSEEELFNVDAIYLWKKPHASE